MEKGSVRIPDAQRTASPRFGRGRVALAVIVISGGVVTLFGGSPANESDRSAVTIPVPPPDQPTPNLPEPAIAHPEIQSPLDTRVPGFTGTLVLTMATGEGTETWRWTSGPEGSLSRSAPIADIYDARPDPTGTWVLGIHRYTGQSRIEAGLDARPVPVVWGATSFAWSTAGGGDVGWIETNDPTAVAFQVGRHIETGIWFAPAGVYEPSDPTTTSRMVALDDIGFIIEQVTSDRRFSVLRVDREGHLTGSAAGVFAGISPGGQVAVARSDSTQLVSGPAMEDGAVLERPFTSAVWSSDGNRLAVTGYDQEAVEIIEGAGRRRVEVGPIQPAVLTWDAAGRFVVLSGHLESDEPVLVFIDSATLDVRTLVVTAHPVAGVAIS